MKTKKVVIDTTTNTEIVQRLLEKLRTYYVFPILADEICSGLQKHLAEGEYKDIADGETLALALTKHMQEISQDKHLQIQWYPEPLPDQEGPMFQNQEWMDEWHQEAELDNFGLHKVERLPGNIGYLEIHLFSHSSWARATIVAAMNFLANTSILIVDLRNCLGGDPDTIALISSYFLMKNVYI